MTNADLTQMSTTQLTALADHMRCPDGMRDPVTSRPLPRGRRALVELIEGMRQRRADSDAIARALRG